MKFEKAPDGSRIRTVEQPPTQAWGQGQVHLRVEEEAEIREIDGGLDPQRGFEQREPELNIPPLEFEGVQFEATFPESMMSESAYTAGPSFQPSFVSLLTPSHHLIRHLTLLIMCFGWIYLLRSAHLALAWRSLQQSAILNSTLWRIAWIGIRLASLLSLSIYSRDLSVWRITWISNKLHLVISSRGLNALRATRRVSMRR